MLVVVVVVVVVVALLYSMMLLVLIVISLLSLCASFHSSRSNSIRSGSVSKTRVKGFLDDVIGSVSNSGGGIDVSGLKVTTNYTNLIIVIIINKT